ncbi:sn-glycerol-3-phosphate ABC transporter permease UgpA [Cardiobacteriaceae bacterium TAE3-ERU3]|nr:sn-glycerol-3-phosphate ABC transporter permease UgpA [Cardiobacteriaceae bacterium TAE3-ERU3]
MIKRVHFSRPILPYLLLAPQVIITLIFFIWPAFQAIKGSMYLEDPFGLSSQFVGLEHFRTLWEDESYRSSFGRTFFFAFTVAASSMLIALILAAAADYLMKRSRFYRSFLIIPYAVAPVLAGSLWMFLFNPTIGIIANFLHDIGIYWNYRLSGGQAMALIIIAASWNMISYNFLFFIAGMQAIPRSLIEAAAIDGAGPVRRFFSIIFPLLSPTTFFLLVMNVVYAFFDTFGIVHAVTGGGPGDATEILVYKVYKDGFEGMNYGFSAAQSVVLIVIVVTLTVFQFKFIERKVSYA